VIVDWSYADDRRLVRSLRIKMPITGSKDYVVLTALEAYKEPCKREGTVLGVWVTSGESRL
jgi:hypothetical protein